MLFTRPFGMNTDGPKKLEDVDVGIATVLNDPALIVEGIPRVDPMHRRSGCGLWKRLRESGPFCRMLLRGNWEDWNKYFINKYGENNVIWKVTR